MKTKVLSEDALAAMFLQEVETSAEEKVEVEASEVSEETELPNKQVEGEEVEIKAEENVEDEADPIVALQSEFDEFKAESEKLVADAEAKVADAEAKMEAVEASAQAAKDIVIGLVSKMRCSLQIAAVDMADWKLEDIVKEYESTQKSFIDNLPVGGVVKEPKQESKEAKVVNSSLDASAYRSLGFK